MNRPNEWLRIGAISGALAVSIGALGAHGLESSLKAAEKADPSAFADYPVARRMDVFETGMRYQMYHSLALLGVGLSGLRSKAASAAGWLFLGGIVLFSGSLYALGATGMKWLGMIAPFGGIALIAGWVAFALAIPKHEH